METHFGHLYFQRRSFGHLPQLLGGGINVDRMANQLTMIDQYNDHITAGLFPLLMSKRPSYLNSPAFSSDFTDPEMVNLLTSTKILLQVVKATVLWSNNPIANVSQCAGGLSHL